MIENEPNKFRAFHKTMKKVIKVDAIDFTGKTIRSGDSCIIDDSINGGCYLLNNCVLEEYVEKEDKYNNPIYEHDIVLSGLGNFRYVITKENGTWVGKPLGKSISILRFHSFEFSKVIGHYLKDVVYSEKE